MQEAMIGRHPEPTTRADQFLGLDLVRIAEVGGQDHRRVDLAAHKSISVDEAQTLRKKLSAVCSASSVA
jgi:hypothetical protein